MHEYAVLQVESEVRRVLTNNEFAVYYQPVVSITTEEVMGCEALVR